MAVLKGLKGAEQDGRGVHVYSYVEDENIEERSEERGLYGYGQKDLHGGSTASQIT